MQENSFRRSQQAETSIDLSLKNIRVNFATADLSDNFIGCFLHVPCLLDPFKFRYLSKQEARIVPLVQYLRFISASVSSTQRRLSVFPFLMCVGAVRTFSSAKSTIAILATSGLSALLMTVATRASFRAVFIALTNPVRSYADGKGSN